MKRDIIVPLTAMHVPLFLFLASCASGGEGNNGTEIQIRYPSPTAVFDAYREARDKREWRKVFSLLTTDAQNDAVFESLFACAAGNPNNQQEIIKKYVDIAAVDAEYEKKYMEKHGIDIAESNRLHGSDPKYKPRAPDRDLKVDATALHVKDKAGFVEAVAKLSEKNPVSPLGALEHLVVKGDTATGSAKETVLPRSGESPLKSGQSPPVYEKPFEFRRVNGSWLLDSF
jgi:hypothetical protein